ncbi:unnamed protein product [Prorocentrum cordatum]|uniref:Potassium channel inwardly rectifying transmembrane domain-containing protein n=1 Tax=Prorocentrum cordatum TaxID=2364126 RepID=A0ABN9XAV9_9DINO|nr:unnamed protein product [Polarella glacialis]
MAAHPPCLRRLLLGPDAPRHHAAHSAAGVLGLCLAGEARDGLPSQEYDLLAHQVQDYAPSVRIKRVLERNAPHQQSRGQFNIDRTTEGSHWLLLRTDVYHTVINMPFTQLIPLFVVVYVSSWLLFAVLWMYVSEPCGCELTHFKRAFFLSMETMMTIGYGVPDPYFNDCDEVIPVIVTEALFGLLLDAAFLNTLFQRFSRAFERAATVVFSAASLLEVVDQEMHWTFRVCELRRQPLLEPLLRVHCVRVEPCQSHPDRVEVKVLPVALSQPSEDIADAHALPVPPLPAGGGRAQDRSLHPLAPPPAAGCDGSDPTPDEVHRHLRSLPYLELIAIVSGTDGVTGDDGREEKDGHARGDPAQPQVRPLRLGGARPADRELQRLACDGAHDGHDQHVAGGWTDYKFATAKLLAS